MVGGPDTEALLFTRQQRPEKELLIRCNEHWRSSFVYNGLNVHFKREQTFNGVKEVRVSALTFDVQSNRPFSIIDYLETIVFFKGTFNIRVKVQTEKQLVISQHRLSKVGQGFRIGFAGFTGLGEGGIDGRQVVLARLDVRTGARRPGLSTTHG